MTSSSRSPRWTRTAAASASRASSSRCAGRPSLAPRGTSTRSSASIAPATTTSSGKPSATSAAAAAAHIPYQPAARTPIRAGGRDGSLPAPGWDGTADWTGYVPFDELPRLLDPPSGAIVAANNAPVGADYPYFLGREWDAGYRAARISQLLAEKKRFSPDDFQEMQLDDRLLRGDSVIAVAADAAPTTADGRIVRARVAQWDGTTPVDSLGAAAGEVFAYRLVRDVFDDELGDGTEKDALARRFVGSDQAAGVLVRLLEELGGGRADRRPP